MTESTYFLVLAALLAVGLVVNRILARAKRDSKDTRPPYIVALGALADKDVETAFREFKNAVRHDSSNADAYLRLGELFLERGDAARAHQLHRELAARPSLPRELMARVHLALARDLLAFGKIDKAAEAAEESARLDESAPGGLETLLEIREKLGDLEGAFKVKREIVKRKAGARTAAAGDLASYRARQGLQLLERGDSKGAEKLLKDAQRYDSENRETNTGWGLLQEQLGNYPEAIEAWEALLHSHPEEAAPVFRNLERVHFLDGSFSRMEQTYKRFLQSFSEHAGACFGLARFLRRKGQLDESLEICRRGLEARPDSLELQALSVALLLQSGRAAEAESQVDAWITRLVGDGTSSGVKRPSWSTKSVAGDAR